ncbi:hypothetical protein ACU4GD_05590 [Cupriavidus basilensis]
MEDGIAGVMVFFALAFVVTALMLYFYTRSLRITLLALVVALLRGRLAAWLAAAAWLWHRPDVNPRALPHLLDRGVARGPDDQRLEAGSGAGP